MGRVIVASDLATVAKAGDFGLPCKTKEIRRGKPSCVPGDALADCRVERPDVADEQVRRPQHAMEEARAVELCGVEPAATQQPGQMRCREMLVPALGRRDIADQAVGIVDVSLLVVGP